MNFGSSILSRSYSRLPDYDSTRVPKPFSFECVNCASRIVVNFDRVINSLYGWEEEVGKLRLEQIQRYFDFNIVGKAPDGGWSSVVTDVCPTCETCYLIYAGVEEYANSAYQVTLQGIVEINDE